MITDSSPWKQTLARDAEMIERWAGKAQSERRSVLIERKIFLSAYSLRKLSEDHRLSSATLSAQAKISVARSLKEGFSNLRHWPEKYFDMHNLTVETMPWRKVLNLIVHSTIFLEVHNDDGHLEAFMVTSDKEQKRGLVRVPLVDFIALIRTASDDYPSAMTQVWNEDKKKWIVWTGHSLTSE